MTVQVWKFQVGPLKQEKGLRLDQLVSMHTGLSKRKVRAIIKIGGVQINRKRIKVAGKIVTDESEISVAYNNTLGTPANYNIPILFEDDWLLIVDKPADIASQGTRASDQHDLIAMLRRQHPNQKLALQHRLDQGTSGILIVAKHPLAYLNNQFQSQEIKKTYLARITKPINTCSVNLPIGLVHGTLPTVRGCSGNLLDPKPAITDFCNAKPSDIAELVPGYWVEAKPHTGRTHQIRIHLASLDRPILGDTFYNGEKSDRLWLHSWKLALQHPVTGEQLSLTAPPNRFFINNNDSKK